MLNYIESVCRQHNLSYISSQRVHGGDINEAYAVNTGEKLVFMKINSAAKYPCMFRAEAEGLAALRANTLLKVPAVLTFGELGGRQYIFLEWLQKRQACGAFWTDFAVDLARLHRTSHTSFGWNTQNYIGSLIQTNTYTLSWDAFYATNRLLPLLQKLFDNGTISATDLKMSDKVCHRFGTEFPVEPPALVHGDLWSGNYMPVQTEDLNGNTKIIAAIYDPAVYFGHREMDLGMTLLFGGFDKNFYASYNDFYPLEKDWRKRVSLTQLYPLLVHAALFGGDYVERCRKILRLWK